MSSLGPNEELIINDDWTVVLYTHARLPHYRSYIRHSKCSFGSGEKNGFGLSQSCGNECIHCHTTVPDNVIIIYKLMQL